MTGVMEVALRVIEKRMGERYALTARATHIFYGNKTIPSLSFLYIHLMVLVSIRNIHMDYTIKSYLPSYGQLFYGLLPGVTCSFDMLFAGLPEHKTTWHFKKKGKLQTGNPHNLRFIEFCTVQLVMVGSKFTRIQHGETLCNLRHQPRPTGRKAGIKTPD